MSVIVSSSRATLLISSIFISSTTTTTLLIIPQTWTDDNLKKPSRPQCTLVTKNATRGTEALLDFSQGAVNSMNFVTNLFKGLSTKDKDAVEKGKGGAEPSDQESSNVTAQNTAKADTSGVSDTATVTDQGLHQHNQDGDDKSGGGDVKGKKVDANLRGRNNERPCKYKRSC